MLFLFRDSCQHDGGIHYLFARWAWRHPALFVGVWSRPLFTVLYAFPALAGYLAARALTVVICLLTAWQTWRLAEQVKLRRSPFVMALLFLQPSFFLFCADTMTEPLFALVFVVALRLHVRGRINAGALVASLLILIRPEGLFTSLLWAYWIIRARFGSLRSVLRTPHFALLSLLPLAYWPVRVVACSVVADWRYAFYQTQLADELALLRYDLRRAGIPELSGTLAGDCRAVAVSAVYLWTVSVGEAARTERNHLGLAHTFHRAHDYARVRANGFGRLSALSLHGRARDGLDHLGRLE
jgi:hypothetical protein